MTDCTEKKVGFFFFWQVKRLTHSKVLSMTSTFVPIGYEVSVELEFISENKQVFSFYTNQQHLPENEIPVRPSDKIIGTETLRCSHSAVLSPVQIAPYL